MKTFWHALLVSGLFWAFLSTNAFAQPGRWAQPPGISVKTGSAPVRVEPESLEFGDVRPWRTEKGTVRLYNDTEEPLRILATRSTCACTAQQLENQVIPPGESVEMVATFDSRDYFGHVQRYIMILFEGYAQPTQVYINANVNDGVRAEATFDPPGQCRTGVIELTSIDGMPFEVESANYEEPVFVDGFDPKTDEPRTSYTIKWDLTGIPAEELPKYFLVELDHPEAPTIDLSVMNNEYVAPRELRRWGFSKQRMKLYNLAPNETREVYVNLNGSFEDPLEALDEIQTETLGVDVRVLGMRVSPKGLTMRLGITPETDYRGLAEVSLTITAQQYTETMSMVGRVSEYEYRGPLAIDSDSEETDG